MPTDEEDLQIKEDLTRDLLSRLVDPDESTRETAIETLAVSTEDDDWRPNELIRQEGIQVLAGLLADKNEHIVLSTIETIIAIAAAGEEEALISGGIIAALDQIQDHEDPAIQKKVKEALWLIEPEVQSFVTSKPKEDY